MSTRNNLDRFGASAPQPSDSPATIPQGQSTNQSGMHFVVPTEVVDLPSKGLYYPPEHPLHKKESVEIRYMTARDEDILVNQSYLKRGTTVDKLLESVIVDKSIPVSSLLVGDKNAMIVATRITGYGSEYITKVVCPSCFAANDFEFDLLDSLSMKTSDNSTVEHTQTENGTYVVTTPRMELQVEMRPTSGFDEDMVKKTNESRTKNKLPPMGIIDIMATYIVSVNGNTDRIYISQALEAMPAMDAKYIRFCHDELMPNVDLAQRYECPSCGHEQEMEVPFTSDFFWPK